MAIIAPVDSNGVISNTTNTKNSISSTKSSTANSLDKDAFLQLLVAEMQYQDPLEPSSNTDYIAQLATFSQVEEMQNMGDTLQQNHATELVGKQVIMKTQTADGETGYIAGKVDYVVSEEGITYLGINGKEYDVKDLDTVIDSDYWDTIKDKF